MDNARQLVIIPALNEEKTIGQVIEDTRKFLPSADILVVNDGSTDRTSEIAREMNTLVVDLPFNLGYGAALQTGFRFADKYRYDTVITMDADGQHIPSSAGSLFAAAEREHADVVIGSRFLEKGYTPGFLRSIGISVFSIIAKVYTGETVTDPTSGFQLLNRNAFTYLSRGDNYPHDYPDVNIIMALHRNKFRVVEAPVRMVSSPNNKSMHSGMRPIWYVIKMVLAIVMVLLRREDK